MNRKLLLINFFILIKFFYYFKKNINLDDLSLIFNSIKIKDIIIIFILFLLRPILITVRWFILVRNFTNIYFLDFFKNIILGSSLNFITSSSIALDVVKFAKIQKDLGLNKSIFLVILDKFYALIFKIFFLILIFNLFNFFIIKTYIFEFLIISISLPLTIFFFRNKLLSNFYKLVKKKI